MGLLKLLPLTGAGGVVLAGAGGAFLGGGATCPFDDPNERGTVPDGGGGFRTLGGLLGTGAPTLAFAFTTGCGGGRLVEDPKETNSVK